VVEWLCCCCCGDLNGLKWRRDFNEETVFWNGVKEGTRLALICCCKGESVGEMV
jgi:hypothetical protein